MAKNKPKKKLTKKQARFVKAVLDPGVDTIAEASRIAGLTNRNYGVRLMKQNEAVRDSLKAFVEKLDAYGATDDVQALRLAEGLHAEKRDMFGRVVGLDRGMIHKYLELISKIKQYVSGGGDQPVNDNRKQYVIVIGDSKDPLDEII